MPPKRRKRLSDYSTINLEDVYGLRRRESRAQRVKRALECPKIEGWMEGGTSKHLVTELKRVARKLIFLLNISSLSILVSYE
jgi:hypothetical protein